MDRAMLECLIWGDLTILGARQDACTSEEERHANDDQFVQAVLGHVDAYALDLARQTAEAAA